MVENGTIPASSHGFPTSRILETIFLHFLHFIFTESTHGRCGEFPSKLSQPSTARFFNSSFDPITSKFPHSHSKIGKANPQYLFLEINQSCILASQSNSRSLPKAGIQLILCVASVKLSRKVFFDFEF